MNYRIRQLVCTTTLLLTATAICDADDLPAARLKLAESIKSLADDIQRYVANEPNANGAIRVGTFRGPDDRDAPTVQRMLKAALKERQVKVLGPGGGGYTVQGDFYQDDDQRATAFTVRIKDTGGRVSKELNPAVIVTSSPLQVELLQPSAANFTLSGVPKKDRPAGSEDFIAHTTPVKPGTLGDILGAALKRPNLVVASETIARFDDESPYGIEILKRDATTRKYRELAIDTQKAKRDGVAFVKLNKGDVFAVRIRNSTPDPVGVSLVVDGVNSFAFSEVPAWQADGRMVCLRDKAVFLGWNKNGVAAGNTYEFKIGDYAGSPAERHGSTAKVGTITASFFVCSRGKGADDPKMAVVQGSLAKTPLKAVPVTFGPILGVVSVSYVSK